jgi:L-lysine exporter family protein LysE/ArgO
MILAFLTGFVVGFSLILAIGAQNSFVLRQGILRKHVFCVALFCSISDTLLIIAGITSISLFFNNVMNSYSDWLFGVTALWLFGYGVLRIKDVIIGNDFLNSHITADDRLISTLIIAAVLTFGNPHVYLDTVILIGSISEQFHGNNKVAFAIGASMASFVFFFGLAYGARLLTPIMQHQLSWRILNALIAVIMFSIGIKMAFAGNWL